MTKKVVDDAVARLIKEIENLDYAGYGHRPPTKTKWCGVKDYLAVSCPYCRILGLLDELNISGSRGY